jgi:hypothetical protein
MHTLHKTTKPTVKSEKMYVRNAYTAADQGQVALSPLAVESEGKQNEFCT